ncbi:probable glutamate receptor [Portunus trituberculatus]|uniref:probable glutamate receptor n=1 Tax=Portunus trituberculatus TaxID=210409 RepID=UPI001E1CBBC2|nr:probable glutamate receptor [Portunus trituberculatus]
MVPLAFVLFTVTLFLGTQSTNVTVIDALNAILEASDSDIILHFKEADVQGVTTEQLRAPRGIGLFEVPMDGRYLNVTHRLMAKNIALARQVRRISYNVMVLVTSDDTAFLSLFAFWSLKGRLLVWSTKLLIFTQVPLNSVHLLHKVLSQTNSLLLTRGTNNQRFIMSIVQPYSKPGSVPVDVASWTPQRGLSAPPNQLFSEKFEKIKSSRKVYVTMVEDATHKPAMIKDRNVPGGHRLVFTGYMVTVLDYIARGLNFSYGFKQSPDGTYGGKRTDGSWTGMVGQVFREEADLGLGPFVMTAARAGDVDYTSPVKILGVRILAGQGGLEVDPWAFVMPLAPLESVRWDDNAWWWERVVLGVWLLTTLVLTRSYEGNLMSLLAVRHVPQPYQSLRAILDDPRAVMIWQKGSSNVELIRTAESGIFREVHEAEEKERLKLLAVPDYPSVLETDVINGRHVIIDLEDNLLATKSKHFSVKGRCSFYFGRETIVSQSVGMIGHKTNPLVHFMSKWVLSMNEAGLFDHWYTKAKPNSTSCVSLPSKITVSAPFSFSNSWVMFVLLLCGLGASLQVLLLEVLHTLVLR